MKTPNKNDLVMAAMEIHIDAATFEINQLRAQLAAERAIKAELVAALEAFVRPFENFTGTVSETMRKGRAALARAKEASK